MKNAVGPSNSHKKFVIEYAPDHESRTSQFQFAGGAGGAGCGFATFLKYPVT